jgi:hypothetical protein
MAQGTHTATAINDGTTPIGHTHAGAVLDAPAANPHQSPPRKLKMTAAYANASASAEKRWSSGPATTISAAAACGSIPA